LKETIVIRVENVSKKYCKSLKGSMLYGVMDIGRNMLGFSSHSERLRRGEFWALNEVSLEVNREETLGLIGPNGGRVGALIAVGAGFHPLLTGRENIYIKGAILGMSKREIDRKFSSIVDFADIGDFLDAPIKHYSSGMFVRLGFSVVINSEPDILLVDEVLAVGDKEFQMKCYRKIHEIINEGAAVILVSHNELTILEHSKRCICLESGRIRFAGSSEEVIGAYNREMSQH
jgi:lipopolysaccharide transport system ATP-binding protein